MKPHLKTRPFFPRWERHPAAKIFSASPPLYRKSGFTLIEVIVTIIAASILGLIFMNFMGTAMSKSVRSIELVKSEAGAEETMERIIGDYVKKMNQDHENVLTFIQTEINTNKRYGDNVSADFITFDTSGKESAYTGSDPKLKRTLKVTIAAEGNDLIALLTRSRGENTPPVPF
jgi:prepilin-type N-terminal cleavage/methylation domain-containing protein